LGKLGSPWEDIGSYSVIKAVAHIGAAALDGVDVLWDIGGVTIAFENLKLDGEGIGGTLRGGKSLYIIKTKGQLVMGKIW